MPCRLLSVGSQESIERKASAKITKLMYNEFEDAFSGVGCFECMLSLEIKEASKHYITQ